VDIAICWSNIGGTFNYPDLAKYLQRKNLRGWGLYLFKNGELVIYKLLGRLLVPVAENEYILSAEEILMECHKKNILT